MKQFKITKNRYLAGFSIVVCVLALIRLIFPSVAADKSTVKDRQETVEAVVNKEVKTQGSNSDKQVASSMKSTNIFPVTSFFDADGKERMREEFNFGKYKGWAVADVLKRDPGYFSWMLSSDFTLDTKQVLTRIRLREAQGNTHLFS